MLITAISDLHLGQEFNLGAFKAFLSDQKHRVRPNMLVLCGDILELAWMSWKDLQKQKLAMDTLDELRTFAGSIETVYIPGNHDPKGKLPPLTPIRETDSLELDAVIYMHGHQFDTSTHIWDTALRFPLKRVFPWLYVKLYGTPYEVKSARKERDYREYIGWIFGRAMMFSLGKQRHLVYGHTHAPMLTVLRDERQVANAGDWRDSLSYLEVRDGKISLRFWI